MAELVAELIVSLDGFALGRRSPAVFGYLGPDVGAWIRANSGLTDRVG